MKDTIGHCPYCTKIVFKDASFKGEAEFETNCRHCGKPIVVEVKREIIVIVKPRIQVNLRQNQVDKTSKN